MSAPPAQPREIDWLSWEPASFAKAKEKNKLIIVDVGMEGCTACRWMHEDTYKNADVVRRIDADFVAIQVDSEARPDIGERYSEWAWPATIFMLPDGTQVHAIRGNKRPPNFIPILDDIVSKWRAGKLEPGGVKEEVVVEVNTSAPAKVRDKAASRLDSMYDAELGGFPRGPMKYPVGAPLRALAWRASRGDANAAARLTATTEKYRSLIDPVWGGVWVASKQWSDPILEKRIGGQAAVLTAAAEAYARDPNEAWKKIAADVDRYIERFFLADDGTFFTSQKDEVPGVTIDARTYYALDDKGRTEKGTPAVDHAVYTDQNAALIEAYARFAEVTDDKRYLARAERAARALLDKRATKEGWLLQTDPQGKVAGDTRLRSLITAERMYLSSQASMGLALMQLYRATLDRAWLEPAQKIAASLSALEAPNGDFYSASDDGTGAILGRPRAVDENGKAALFLAQLGTLLRDEAMLERGKRAVSALAARDLNAEGLAIGHAALAAHAVADDVVEITVVSSNPPAEIVEAAKRAGKSPRALVRVEPPGHYPDVGRPVAFVCTDRACTMPLDAGKIQAAVARALLE